MDFVTTPRPVANLARVRLLKLSDLPHIMPLENAAYDFPWSEAIFRDCFNAHYTGLAIEVEGVFLGYGILSLAAGEAHVLNIVIDSTQRSLGLGKKLVKRLIDQARWHRAERVFLEVRVSNHVARRLYAGIGFLEIGVRKAYYPGRQSREDAVVMSLQLNNSGFS